MRTSCLAYLVSKYITETATYTSGTTQVRVDEMAELKSPEKNEKIIKSPPIINTLVCWENAT